MHRISTSISDQVHRLALLAAREAGQSLSRWIAEAMEAQYRSEALRPGGELLAEAVREAYPEKRSARRRTVR
jgi:hypothetical protein